MWRTRISQNPCQIGGARGKSSANSGRVDAGQVIHTGGSERQRELRREYKKAMRKQRAAVRASSKKKPADPTPVEVTIEDRIDALVRRQKATMELRDSLRAIR